VTTGTPGGEQGAPAPGPDARRRHRRLSSELFSALATVLGVLGIVVAVLVANGLGGVGAGGEDPAAGPAAVTATRSRPAAVPTVAPEQIATMAPEEIATDALKDRGPVASPHPKATRKPKRAGHERPERPEQQVPSGAEALARAAQRLAGDQPYSFTITTFNILGSNHTDPGGDARGFAPGRLRTEWAADLLASYGSSVVGFQEIQADQLAAFDSATGGAYDAWPGTSMGGLGIPQNVVWRTSVWQATWRGSITIPFMGGTRPQPIVRLQHQATGREIYVLNIHNSPKDAQGREPERDTAMQIEVAAINELRRDGVPVFIMGDFNEHAEAFCTITGGTDLLAASGGSNDAACHPPAVMRVDWLFGSSDVAFSGFRMDRGAQVRRITDHTVLTSDVSVP
jgi:endonuclease/exonuclease/phosphatase family metal-dependent hydrolase